MKRPSGRVRRVVFLVWIAFLARGAFYSTILPMWEGFDEYAHFAFVHHLKTFGALPHTEELVSAEISRSLRLVPLPWTLNKWSAPAVTHDVYWMLPAAARLARQEALKTLPAELQALHEGEFVEEAKQPPLYYVLGLLALKAASSASLPARVLAMRLFSVLIASLIIPLTFAVSRRVLGETQALLTTVLIASMPGLMIAISRVGNDGLAMVLFGVLTYALVRPEPWDSRGAWLIGIVWGAGLLTKAYFIAALPAILLSAAMEVFKTSPSQRVGRVVKVSAALVLAVAVSAWWYIRTLGTGGSAWVDAAPVTPVGAGDLWSYAARMDWIEAVKNILNTHFWVGGWSFLGVRSWMYGIMRWIFVFALPGGFLWMIRNRRFPAVWCLYGGFWAALLYHAFVNFINAGVPASTGWYLYAVAACEGALLCGAAQWLGPQRQGYAMISLTGLFLLLEAYATHFVLIPYYIGLTSHRTDTTLTMFHISQAMDLGWPDILSRLLVNKPAFLGPGLMVLLWFAFVSSSVGLFILACRYGRAQTGSHQS